MTALKMSIVRISVFALLVFLLSACRNVSAQEWEERAALPEPLYGLNAIAAGGTIYVLGGIDARGVVSDGVLRYDGESNGWEDDLPPMPSARYYAASAVLDGRIFVIGGRGSGNEVLDRVDAFDPHSQTWMEMGDLVQGRYGHSSVVLNGRLFAVGGTSEGGDNFATVESYDPELDRWRIDEDWRLNEPRAALSTVAVGNAAYSFGGFGVIPLAAIERFDPEGGVETIDAPAVFQARGALAAAVVGDSIFVMGGRNASGVLNDVSIFIPSNPLLDRWKSAPPLLNARAGFGAAELDGTIYVVGGFELGRNEEVRSLASMESYHAKVNVHYEREPAVATFALEQNHPNPFASATTIPFRIVGNQSAHVQLDVYDVQGRLVDRLIDSRVSPGKHHVTWSDARNDVPSGMYVYVLRNGTAVDRKMMTRIR